MSHPIEPAPPDGDASRALGDGAHALPRIRRVIGAVALDCRCRVTLDDALDRFAALEQARLRGRALRDARRAKAAIAQLVELLAELDEVSDVEADRTVFGELALLFEAVAEEAGTAADLMRRLEAM